MSEAIFGFIGVLVGAMVPWLREWWVETKGTKKNARYLAVRVICVLDQYVEACAEVATDGGEPDTKGEFSPRVATPDGPLLPEDVDWRSIDHELMYQILSMPGDAELADQAIKFQFSEVAGPPDYEEGFEERKFQYSTLGLRAASLAARLRTTFGIPSRVFNDWNPVEYLDKCKRQIEEERAERFARFKPLDMEDDEEAC